MSTKIEGIEVVCKALGDRTRLRILALLIHGEVCVCDIHESLKIGQPKASRHLAYLRRAGLVRARKEGLWMHYRLAAPEDPVLRTIVEAVTHTLTHVPTAARDVERLRRRTGCCVVTDAGRPDLPCCSAPTVEPVELVWSRDDVE
jgi:ArsR family transcriptional regulator